eukprot:TRINITY_DN12859_c0_g1_i2.p1 TRINITY_DN12859_c0_g1~~TRINITY_DN12859_c0_g1_i2.p1  ORF type:complete len:126 (-),score=20.69 TRINITY_DN12859_c0_g1_i2:26-403(-)
MIRRPPRSTHCISSAASDVYKRQSIFVSLTTISNAPFCLCISLIPFSSLWYFSIFSHSAEQLGNITPFGQIPLFINSIIFLIGSINIMIPNAINTIFFYQDLLAKSRNNEQQPNYNKVQCFKVKF